MNIKFIFKTIIDFLMALIFLLLMFPHATSIRIHEILGNRAVLKLQFQNNFHLKAAEFTDFRKKSVNSARLIRKPTGFPNKSIIIIPLVSIHLILNRKWIKSTVKNIIHGKANDKSRYMFFLSLGLFLSLVITMVSGFLISQFLIPSEVVPAQPPAVHGRTASVGSCFLFLFSQKTAGSVLSARGGQHINCVSPLLPAIPHGITAE
jgi:ABC-type multidrug transport system fused ATPase/permease subunit